MKKLLLTILAFCAVALPTTNSAISAGDVAYKVGAGIGGTTTLAGSLAAAVVSGYCILVTHELANDHGYPISFAPFAGFTLGSAVGCAAVSAILGYLSYKFFTEAFSSSEQQAPQVNS